MSRRQRTGPLRVAQVITTLARGGAQATVLASLDMDDHGVEVTVLAGPDDTGEGSHWNEMGERTVLVPPMRRAIDPAGDARAVRWLVDWLSSYRPDVVHTHSSKAGVLGRMAARLVGIPVVHTVHGWSFAPQRGPAGRGRERRSLGLRGVIGLERRLAGWSDALVVVTPLDARAGLAAGIGRPEQYRLIRSGIDLDQPRSGRQDRVAIRAGLRLSDQFVVGTVGRLAGQKDPLALLAGFAWADLPHSHLVIVGEGPLRADLEAAITAAGLDSSVTLLGQRPDAARLVASFDLFALTSHWEGLPRSLVEAVAAGVPVVATPSGGVPEVVRSGETGTLVPRSDPAALAEALTDLHARPDHRALMARAAEAEVAQFSVDAMRRELRALWRQVAGVETLAVGAVLP